MKSIGLSAVVVLAVLTTGCASILNESTQAVNVSASNGKSISGTIDGKTFEAPGVVQVERAQKGKVISVNAAGCSKSTALQSSVDPKFFINILSGGAFGSTTDYSTEKMWKYSDSVVIACGQ